MIEAALQFQPTEARTFLQEVAARSGQNLAACYQCRRCAAGCAVGDETGFVTPNRLIRMVMLGDRDQALSNELVWRCVSCYTCGERCPNDIQTARITETLKKMAKEEHVPALQPKVAHFHDAFLESGVRWGRVNEMEFMGAYEMKNAFLEARRFRFGAIMSEIRQQMRLGLAMLRLKRMHMGFLKSGGRAEIQALRRKSQAARAAR
jgi:heterodisulfide reductase subunit C